VSCEELCELLVFYAVWLSDDFSLTSAVSGDDG
jgi:hypothetical protein